MPILIISDPNLKQESSVTLVVPLKKNMGHIQAGDYSFEITSKNMRNYKQQKRLLQRAKKHSRESQKTSSNMLWKLEGAFLGYGLTSKIIEANESR